uniref:Uncharacterized protein n=1 Tax=Sphaerodactylus townsendi TaxID=933632 RepID=A0ACB8FS64_9SAUR
MVLVPETQFWQFGKWVEVVVDDQLLLDETGKTLKYGRSTDENEFWMPLLEKAFAKLNGSYEAIIRGFARNAFVDLTGGIGETIWLPNCPPKNLCKRAQKALDRNSLMAASITGKRGKRPDGLYNHHAYSITKIHKMTVGVKEMEFVRLRNPHGKNEWTGDWRDDDETNWSKVDPKEKEKMQVKKEDGKPEDGEFWMSLDDFRKVFHLLHICHLDANAPREKDAPFRWHSNSFQGRWKSASGLNNPDAFWTNPQFYVSLSEESEILISLIQKSRKDLLWIDFDVYKYLDNPDQRKRLLSSLKVEKKVTSWLKEKNKVEDRTESLKLTRGDYLIIPMNRASEEGDFLLRIFTEKKHLFRKLEIK